MILIIGCSYPDSHFHFEGTFLNSDGSAAVGQLVEVFDTRMSVVGQPDIEVHTDSDGHYQFAVPIRNLDRYPSIPLPVRIISGSITMYMYVYPDWLDGSRDYSLGQHQAWPTEAQATSSNTAVDLSWQPPVDEEDPVFFYGVAAVERMEENTVWIENTTTTSMSIDVRKVQDFANGALLAAEARVWGGFRSEVLEPPIYIWWITEVSFEQTSSVPPSRGATCTRLRDGIQEPLNNWEGTCLLTDGVLVDYNFSFPSDCGSPITTNQTFTIDLGAVTTVNAIGLIGLFLSVEAPLDIQFSSDNISFTTVETSPAATYLPSRFIEFTSPSPARYVRLQVDTGCIYRLDEVGIY